VQTRLLLRLPRAKSEDVLLPLLEIFLSRGFNASATIHNQSSLHMALWRGHEKSAFALVRAGADIYQTAPKSLVPEEGDEDVWTSLEACSDMYGNKTAFSLEQAANASAAIAGPRTRRKILRASAGDTSKMAEKALKTAKTLLAAGRSSEAAGAYTEAIEYPVDALEKQDRGIALKNLSTCLTRVGRMEDAVRYARQFCREFPGTPCPFFTLATTIWHRQAMNEKNTNEIVECVEKADRLLGHARGNEPWLMDIRLGEMRAKLRNLKESAKRAQNAGPAVKAAQTAIDEFNKDDMDIAKAAHAISTVWMRDVLAASKAFENVWKNSLSMLIQPTVRNPATFQQLTTAARMKCFLILRSPSNAQACLKNNRLRSPLRATHHTRMYPMQQEKYSPSYALTALR
jgi:tetratricopeptide (TPR) repeat protein